MGANLPLWTDLSRDLDAALRHAYRKSYVGFEIERALPNVELAPDTVRDATREIEAFCRSFGIVPTDAPPRFGAPLGDAPGAKSE